LCFKQPFYEKRIITATEVPPERSHLLKEDVISASQLAGGLKLFCFESGGKAVAIGLGNIARDTF
jgi:hypothetical protein